MSGQTLDRLIYMANQIGREFASQRPREAVDATWDHLWHFWDPRTRSMIVAHLREGGEGLSDIARAAVAKLAGDAEPAPVTQATEFNSADQGASGAGSDAG
jgi:formate dehydrogenase subunit delta